MSISLGVDERIKDVGVDDDSLTVDLMDGRRISVPIVWFPRLVSATRDQRRNWRIVGAGYGINWPDIDEDLGVRGLLRVSQDDTRDTSGSRGP